MVQQTSVNACQLERIAFTSSLNAAADHLRGRSMYDVVALQFSDARNGAGKRFESRSMDVVALNDADRACGAVVNADGWKRPAVWSQHGRLRLLECGPHGGSALAINRSGMVAGYEYTSRQRTNRRAVIWIRGDRIELPGLPGVDDSVAAAINRHGQIGGRSNGDYVIWDGLNADALRATPVDAEFSSFFGPNDRGLVAGRIGSPESGGCQQLGFWCQGHTAVRAFPSVDETYRYYVTGVNRLNQVLVTGSDDHCDDLGWFAVVSEGREIVVDRRHSGLKLIAHGLNDTGTVVGRAELSNGRGFPFIWTAGEPIDLNRLLPAAAGFTIFAATAINNCGTILAVADDSHGVEHHVLLVPAGRASK